MEKLYNNPCESLGCVAELRAYNNMFHHRTQGMGCG